MILVEDKTDRTIAEAADTIEENDTLAICFGFSEREPVRSPQHKQFYPRRIGFATCGYIR